MKRIALIVMSLAVVAAANAQSPSKPETPKAIKCVVMPTNDVNIATATKTKMFADYKGRRYFFCCGGCPEAFKKDPAKYAKGPSIPTPKAPKKA